MSNQWPTAEEGRIPTKNKMGFMFLDVSGASPSFIQEAAAFPERILDLGCAYGIVTLAALAQSHCQMVAFDLSQEHLDILSASIPEKDKERVSIVQGRFPDHFNFPDHSFDAIHSSHMFHFLNGADTEKGLEKCFKALKPGGKLYINCVSLHFKPFKGILSIYQNNLKEGAQWPGMISDFKDHLPEEDARYAPEFIHVHTKEEFEQLLKKAGFSIDQVFYYDLKEPAWFASEGKGFIGAIATKVA